MITMKGMSLPIETVVLLILMVVVLGAILAFFVGVFGPANTEKDIMMKQQSLCRQYAMDVDPGCKALINAAGSASAWGDDKKNNPLVVQIKNEVCNKPAGNPVCTGSNEYQCVQKCCSGLCGPVKKSSP